MDREGHIICHLAVAKWLRLYIKLPVGTAMIFISEKQKEDCMTEKLNILRVDVRKNRTTGGKP